MKRIKKQIVRDKRESVLHAAVMRVGRVAVTMICGEIIIYPVDETGNINKRQENGFTLCTICFGK